MTVELMCIVLTFMHRSQVQFSEFQENGGGKLFPFSQTYYLCIVLLCISQYCPIGIFDSLRDQKLQERFPHPYQTLDPFAPTPEQLNLQVCTIRSGLLFFKNFNLQRFFLSPGILYQNTFIRPYTSPQNITDLLFSFFLSFSFLKKISYPLSFPEWIISLHLCSGFFYSLFCDLQSIRMIR